MKHFLQNNLRGIIYTRSSFPLRFRFENVDRLKGNRMTQLHAVKKGVSQKFQPTCLNKCDDWQGTVSRKCFHLLFFFDFVNTA